jgi:hypothetical protein
MTKLSPAARSVAWAYDNAPETPTGNHRYHWLAAALRAARDEVAPSKTIKDISYVHQSYVDGYEDALDEILAIAIELEAQ